MTDERDDESTENEDTVHDDEVIDSADALDAAAEPVAEQHDRPVDPESERAELEALDPDAPRIPLDRDDPAPESSPDVAVPTVVEEGSDTSFALLAFALLVLVGGSVFFVGKLINANKETEQAQAQAEDALAEFDSQLPSTVPILPFDDEQGFITVAPSTTETPQAQEDDEPELERSTTTTTSVARPDIDPAHIALAFVNRVPGDEYGVVGYIDPAGDRHITQLECDRVDLNEAGGICLSATAGLAGTGRGLLLEPSLNPTTRFGVNNPSRAAVSPDGAVVAWTGFTSGHSYSQEGGFSTTTQLISVERSIAADLERIFSTYRNDELVNDIDRNFWGVSFVDSDLFYATLGTLEEGTEIVAGRVSNSRLDVVASNASCPEVSPDGKTIVAKEQRGEAFQLIAIDLETGSRRDLGETRSVDDQVEWIDNSTILYGMPNPEEGTSAQPAFDIYALNTAPGSSPQLIVPFAESPAA